MKKLIVTAVLPFVSLITFATPAHAAPALTLTNSPICIGFGSIGYCVPFT